jgi:hypothetical protein
MEIKLEFVLREIAGDLLLVPAGKTALDFNGMITLNEVGGEVWKLLPLVADEEELIARLLDEYDVEESVLRQDVEAFLGELRALKII